MRLVMLAALLAAPPAIAQDATPVAGAGGAQGDVSVTIYNNDQALVEDVRRLTLPAGVSRQEFADVSQNIRPETVRLSAEGVTIVEQNFDYDLLSPDALMEKAVGRTVTIVRTNPGTGAELREQARVLAANNGVVLDIGGRIEVLRDDGLPARVIFPGIPPNLRARPTLSVTLDSARAGARPVTLAYLTNGLAWSADYVALFDEAAGALDLQGWITLTNRGDTPFVNADTVLVAGAPQMAAPPGRLRPMPPGQALPGRPGTETANRERIGDYYLYPLERRTTIAANQQKQVSFLSVGGVPATRGYRFRNAWLGATEEPASADAVLSFSSSREGGLGDALPAGTVRVYMRDTRGQPQFIGENAIAHTPMGSDLAIRTGEAFDIKVRPVVEGRERIASDEWERTARFRITTAEGTREVVREDAVTFWRTRMRYDLTNASPQPVTVEVVQAGLDGWWSDTRVPAESQPGTQVSRDERMWRVQVPANGSATLTASFDTRY
ncbi:DUF4139 domain-containing protein [Sphingomonas baiyangensis]|uniref:DUF4139 domain-containing protein n=1 Tax=Sphingomonas baiyangensis TaxID=2572576 RepID=A0A4U1L6F5_9SPHN|nr:DUF4139 domain-containing protein [Sphingomonas baiyangensis]TKD51855.1 DUF4139 domain-containing protein [Sphingomonas baiyangensis]